ncbi:MAG: fumarylacetoacetate hydrolase [Marmoricola sp.]|jgi:2-keto-4-pentenoate hydratase/2-oxohepta-3-ene-1,7-dioic acid hydratase in catechol pathway|nr:fumarylacetoacetate hydrolase [Marmoricola sp.]
MRLCTVRTPTGPEAAVQVPGYGVVLTRDLLGRESGDLFDHLVKEELGLISQALEAWSPTGPAMKDPIFEAPYRRPRKILGIGLNYRAHAGDLGADAPRSTPASFLKGDHTIIGPGDDIRLPADVGRVTAEAELGLVIGRECYQVSEEEAMSYVAGVCAVLDQTAEAVLLENPRYLTRVKNYPTFFSFGPNIITMDEVLAAVGDLDKLTVATIHNSVVHRQDEVVGMTFSPAALLSFHSHVMPLYPGDILSTGTPGAVPITAGDQVSCDLGGGLEVLSNGVVD